MAGRDPRRRALAAPPPAAAGFLLALPLLLFLVALVLWPVSHLVAAATHGPGAFRVVLAAGRYRTALVNSLLLSAAAAGSTASPAPHKWTTHGKSFMRLSSQMRL